MGDLFDPTRIVVGLFGAVLPIAILGAPTVARAAVQIVCGWGIAVFAGPWVCERLSPWECDRQQQLAAALVTGLLGWTVAKTVLVAVPDWLLKKIGLGKPGP